MMKAVFISYNQSLTNEVQEILDDLMIRGYTQWTGLTGRGSVNGVKHAGTHSWPEMNNAHLTIIEEIKVPELLNRLRNLNERVMDQGLRAFVWNIEDGM